MRALASEEKSVGLGSFIGFVSGLFVAGLVGLVWGLSEGGGRGGFVAIVSAVALLVVGWIAWKLLLFVRR